jgi:hypothetical protein
MSACGGARLLATLPARHRRGHALEGHQHASLHDPFNEEATRCLSHADASVLWARQVTGAQRGAGATWLITTSAVSATGSSSESLDSST